MSDSAKQHCERGIALLNQSDKEQQALAEFQAAVQADPDNATYHAWQAYAHYRLDQHDQAKAEIERALQLDPNCAVAYYARGVEQQDPDAMIVDANRAIGLDQGLARAYNLRGNAYREKKDYDRAIADYTRAIALDPNDARAYNNRGRAYFNKRDYDRAIADYTQAIALDPNFAIAYYNRGLAYSDKQDYDRAIADYTRAIALDPNFAIAYNNRGNAYHYKQDYDRAIADYTQAYSMNPKSHIPCWGMRAIASKRGDTRAYLIWNARHDAVDGIGNYSSDDPELSRIFNTCHAHLLEVVKANRFRVVDWYPAWIDWGMSTEQYIREGNSYETYRGKYGCGYVLLTDHGLYIQSLGLLSRLKRKGSGLMIKALGLLGGTADLTSIATKDAHWLVSYHAIAGAHVDEGRVRFSAKGEEFVIAPYISGGAEHILTSIDMGQRGELSRIWDPPAPTAKVAAPTPPPVDPIAEIERLGTLLKKGLITQMQFESKRDELLKRM